MQQRNTTFFALVIGTLALLAAPATLQAADAGATRKAFTPDDLVRLYRLSDPEVSPDGRYVAYTLRETDIDANRGRTDIWLLDLNDATKTARRVTQHAANDSTPRWAADGRGFFFLSTRSGSSQIWYIALAGGEAQQVTDLPLDVGSFKVSPQGDRLALTLEVFPDCADLKCSVDRIAARAKEKASGKTYDQFAVAELDRQLRAQHGAIVIWSGEYTSFFRSDMWVHIVPRKYVTAEEALNWCRSSNLTRANCGAKFLSHTKNSKGTTAWLP